MNVLSVFLLYLFYSKLFSFRVNIPLYVCYLLNGLLYLSLFLLNFSFKNKLIFFLFKLSCSAMKFLKVFFHNFNGGLTCFFLYLKFSDFVVYILIFLWAFIFKKKHIFIDKIIKLLIEFFDHCSHFLIDFIDLELGERVKLMLFMRETFSDNILMSVGKELWLIFLWYSARFDTFFSIGANWLSGTASFERFSDWTGFNFVYIFIAFHFIFACSFFILCWWFWGNSRFTFLGWLFFYLVC